MRRQLASTTAVLVLLAVFAAGNSGDASSTIWQGNAAKAVLAADAGARPSGLLPSGAFQAAVSEAHRTLDLSAAGNLPILPPQGNDLRCGHVFSRPGFPDNVRASQGCDYRRQSSPTLAANPVLPSNLTVGRSDAHLGSNRGAVAYSFDGGARFADYDVPSIQADCTACDGGQWTYDATTGPALAWGPDGALYALSVGYDVLRDGYTGVWVLKSNPGLRGSFLHSPAVGSLGALAELSANPVGLVHDNFEDPTKADDQAAIAVDRSPASPFKGSVYVVWSIFDYSCGRTGATYCSSPVFFSRSTDGGATWNDGRIGRPGPPVEISGNNPAFCNLGDAFDPRRDPADCDFSRGAWPVVGPDGAIHVVFDNCNTSAEAVEGLPAVCQLLTVSSSDGGVTWSPPVKVADDHRTQPMNGVSGAIAGGCPMFRQCLPPQGYRVGGAPSMAVDERTGKLAVFWSDFRGGRFTDDAGGSVRCQPCNEDVFAAVSNDGGATWGPTLQVTTSRSAQYAPAGAIDADGGLRVAYYTRQYGDCEATGCQDVRLSTSPDDGPTWSSRRITTDSMPNLTDITNPVEQGFIADRVALAAGDGFIYVAWADTRGLNGLVEEDVYVARVPTR